MNIALMNQVYRRILELFMNELKDDTDSKIDDFKSIWEFSQLLLNRDNKKICLGQQKKKESEIIVDFKQKIPKYEKTFKSLENKINYQDYNRQNNLRIVQLKEQRNET